MASTERKLYILRHAERVDFVFKNWIEECFDANETYNRKDLNMPKSLPKRVNGANGWVKDGPITKIGEYEAQLVGEAMRDKGTMIDVVYCSPAYRCVQTADVVLRELNLQDKVKLKIEPALYEWAGQVDHHFPTFFTADEFKAQGFNVDTAYVPYMSAPDLQKQQNEVVEQLYQRNYGATEQILKTDEKNILIVAHGISLETCTRKLMGKPERSWTIMKLVLGKIWLCGMVALEQQGSDQKWKFIEPPSGAISTEANNTFDWKVLM